MEAIFAVVIFAAASTVVNSAPALTEGQSRANTNIPEQQTLHDYYRDRRSQYQYVPPCAAAAAASAPTTYQVNLSPYHGYPPHNYYGMPQYRSIEMDPEQELLSFSDMDHMMPEHLPLARYAYAIPAAPHVPASYPAPIAPAATTSPTYGVFPNANPGGCSVPLLFSCAPSVVQGRVLPSHPHYTAGNSYRGVDQNHLDSHEESHEEPTGTVHDHLKPVPDSGNPATHH